jgi:hypothetical protein
VDHNGALSCEEWQERGPPLRVQSTNLLCKVGPTRGVTAEAFVAQLFIVNVEDFFPVSHEVEEHTHKTEKHSRQTYPVASRGKDCEGEHCPKESDKKTNSAQPHPGFFAELHARFKLHNV